MLNPKRLEILFWAIRLKLLEDCGPPKQLTDFKSDKLFSFAWSTDGKQLAVSRGGDAADVALIGNLK